MDLQSEMAAEYKHGREEALRLEQERDVKMTGVGLRMGRWQRRIFQALSLGWTVTNPLRKLRGRAKLYQGHYELSFRNLLARMRDDGWTIEREPGVRGGETTATYTARLDF
jgi:hypothetical protein